MSLFPPQPRSFLSPPPRVQYSNEMVKRIWGTWKEAEGQMSADRDMQKRDSQRDLKGELQRILLLDFAVPRAWLDLLRSTDCSLVHCHRQMRTGEWRLDRQKGQS